MALQALELDLLLVVEFAGRQLPVGQAAVGLLGAVANDVEERLVGLDPQAVGLAEVQPDGRVLKEHPQQRSVVTLPGVLGVLGGHIVDAEEGAPDGAVLTVPGRDGPDELQRPLVVELDRAGGPLAGFAVQGALDRAAPQRGGAGERPSRSCPVCAPSRGKVACQAPLTSSTRFSRSSATVGRRVWCTKLRRGAGSIVMRSARPI